MFRAIEKCCKFVEKCQIGFGCVTFSIFTISVVIQVFSRMMKIPMTWTEEVANYAFIWSVFMGASVILNRNQHFKFTFVELKLKHIWLEIYYIAIFTGILMFCIFLVRDGGQLVLQFWNYKWTSLPALRKGYHWLCVPIMGGTMMLYSIGHIAESVERILKKDYRDFDLLKNIEDTEHVEIDNKEGAQE